MSRKISLIKHNLWGIHCTVKRRTGGVAKPSTKTSHSQIQTDALKINRYPEERVGCSERLCQLGYNKSQWSVFTQACCNIYDPLHYTLQYALWTYSVVWLAFAKLLHLLQRMWWLSVAGLDEKKGFKVQEEKSVTFELGACDACTWELVLPDWGRYRQGLYQALSLLIMFILSLSLSHTPIGVATWSPCPPPPSALTILPSLILHLLFTSASCDASYCCGSWREGSQRKPACVDVYTCCWLIKRA